MKRLFSVLIFCFLLTGCTGVLPRITTSTPNTVPQSIIKEKLKGTCKGEAKFNELGELTYCSKGYYAYVETYNKQERKMTFSERIKSFINGLIGWSFWIFIAIVIFTPGLLGVLLGKFIEGAFGIATSVNKRLVKAIQKTKDGTKDLVSSLEAELDAAHKKYITAVKEQEGLK